MKVSLCAAVGTRNPVSLTVSHETMLYAWQRVRVAFAAYRAIKKRRARTEVLRNALLEHCVQQLAHDNVVLQAAAFAAQEQDDAPRRVVPHCLGKWRGSTLSGYLSHDDTTYKENFRCRHRRFRLFSVKGVKM